MPNPLTPRELEIANLIGDGLDTGEIASELDIGYWTVKRYIKSIRQKLGVPRMQDIPGALTEHG